MGTGTTSEERERGEGGDALSTHSIRAPEVVNARLSRGFIGGSGGTWGMVEG